MGQRSSANLSEPVALNAIRVSSQITSTSHTSKSTSIMSTSSVDTQTRLEAPWKYEGYKEFSKWMASDDDLFVFRRFANVNAQVILWMQHQIVQKEVRLEELHNTIKEQPLDSGWRNDSFGWDATNFAERDNLMRDLSALVLHYSKSFG